jgi:ABC-type Mn2+/Zn2+ transport system ATPase subunit
MQSEELISSSGGRMKIGHRWLDFPEFKILSGQKIAIAGKNGAGKSVFLRHLMGWSQPIEGHLFSSLWNRPGKIAWFTHQRNPYMDLLVEDVLWMGLAKKDHLHVQSVLRTYELSSLMQQSAQWLSDGEWVRLMMARIALHKPQMALLDEPTAHLDFIYKEEWKSWVREWNKLGISVCCATHDVDWIMTEADEIWWIEEQQLSILSPMEFSAKFKKNDNSPGNH